jgi:hypothetical protein
VVEDASPWCLGTVWLTDGSLILREYRSGGFDTRISLGAGTVSDDDDVQIVVAGTDSEFFVNGASVGSYASTLYGGNAGAIYPTGNGVMDALELWPYYIYPPFTIPGL